MLNTSTPETSHFLRVMKGNGSRSYMEAVNPSMVPNSLPMPKDNSIMKKIMDQKGEDGPNSLMAWVKMTNARPVPDAAWNEKNEKHEQILKYCRKQF